MNTRSALLALASLSLTTIGCAPEATVDDEVVGEEESAFITGNALTGNAITGNALTGNALTGNALTGNALTGNALTGNALAAIEDPVKGELNRELLRYMVACALSSTQSLDFAWTDSAGVVHQEHLVGQLGLAPEWTTGPLHVGGQKMVSACLAAKVNYYGVHVTISVRSGEKPLLLHPFDPELADYGRIEGAFWGNIWDSQPNLHACFNTSNVNHSRALQRDCAAGHLNADGTIGECGIIDIAGSCSSVCKKFNNSRGYYEDCREQPGVSNKRTDLVITTALP